MEELKGIHEKIKNHVQDIEYINGEIKRLDQDIAIKAFEFMVEENYLDDDWVITRYKSYAINLMQRHMEPSIIPLGLPSANKHIDGITIRVHSNNHVATITITGSPLMSRKEMFKMFMKHFPKTNIVLTERKQTPSDEELEELLNYYR